MADKISLNEQEYHSIKTSFFRVFHTCLDKDMISKDVVGCLFKWAIQLHIDESELDDLNAEHYKGNSEDRDLVLEDIFNIVYMIYLDNKVEEIELKVASQYAKEMGFKSHIVNDLLKAIVTAPFDGYDYPDVRKQLKDILTADGSV